MSDQQQPAGFTEAQCALSFFRLRHRWKEKGSRRGLLRNVRIKDWSHYGEYTRMARSYIRKARLAGWRGSVVAAVYPVADRSSNCRSSSDR